MIITATLGSAIAYGQDQEESEEARSGKTALTDYLRSSNGGDWISAARYGEELASLARENPIGPYLAATAYARLGQNDEAVAWLNEAAHRGYSAVEDISTNEDFEGIRHLPGFLDAISRVEANRNDADAAFASSAQLSIPIIFQKDKNCLPEVVLIVLHGYGGNAESTLERWKSTALAIDALLVVPRAVRPAGSGFTWADTNETELLTRNALRHAASQGYSIDRPLIVSGFSEGANMALELVMNEDFRLIGAITFGAEFTPRLAKKLDEARVEPRRIFMVIGSLDPSRNSNFEAEQKFQARRWPVGLRIIEGLGHDYPESFPDIASGAIAEMLNECASHDLVCLPEPGPR